MIAISTRGTLILDCKVPANENAFHLVCLYLDKYADYDGTHLALTKDYVVQYARTVRAPYDTALLVWRRWDDERLNSEIYYAVDMGANPAAPRWLHAFGAVEHNGETVITLGTSKPKEPTHTYKVGHFRVEIPDGNNDDLSEVVLEFQGESTEPITLKQVFSSNDMVDEFSWWPFAIIIGVLIVIALAWFAFGKATGGEEKERDTYGSREAADYYKTLGDMGDSNATGDSRNHTEMGTGEAKEEPAIADDDDEDEEN